MERPFDLLSNHKYTHSNQPNGKVKRGRSGWLEQSKHSETDRTRHETGGTHKERSHTSTQIWRGNKGSVLCTQPPTPNTHTQSRIHWPIEQADTHSKHKLDLTLTKKWLWPVFTHTHTNEGVLMKDVVVNQLNQIQSNKYVYIKKLMNAVFGLKAAIFLNNAIQNTSPSTFLF